MKQLWHNDFQVGIETGKILWVAGDQAAVLNGEGSNQNVCNGAFDGKAVPLCRNMPIPSKVSVIKGGSIKERRQMDVKPTEEFVLVCFIAQESWREFNIRNGRDYKTLANIPVKCDRRSCREIGVSVENVEKYAGVNDLAQSSSPSRSSFIHSAVGRVSRKVRAKPIMSRASYRFLRGRTMDMRHDRPSMSCSHAMCMPGCRRMASTISEGMTVCPRSATFVTIVLMRDIIAYLCVAKTSELEKICAAAPHFTRHTPFREIERVDGIREPVDFLIKMTNIYRLSVIGGKI